MVKIVFRAEVFKERDLYVALCPQLNVSSFGDTVDEAKESLLEAVEGFLEECERMDTAGEVLEESGFINNNGTWVIREPVVKEMMTVPA